MSSSYDTTDKNIETETPNTLAAQLRAQSKRLKSADKRPLEPRKESMQSILAAALNKKRAVIADDIDIAQQARRSSDQKLGVPSSPAVQVQSPAPQTMQQQPKPMLGDLQKQIQAGFTLKKTKAKTPDQPLNQGAAELAKSAAFLKARKSHDTHENNEVDDDSDWNDEDTHVSSVVKRSRDVNNYVDQPTSKRHRIDENIDVDSTQQAHNQNNNQTVVETRDDPMVIAPAEVSVSSEVVAPGVSLNQTTDTALHATEIQVNASQDLTAGVDKDDVQNVQVGGISSASVVTTAAKLKSAKTVEKPVQVAKDNSLLKELQEAQLKRAQSQQAREPFKEVVSQARPIAVEPIQGNVRDMIRKFENVESVYNNKQGTVKLAGSGSSFRAAAPVSVTTKAQEGLATSTSHTKLKNNNIESKVEKEPSAVSTSENTKDERLDANNSTSGSVPDANSKVSKSNHTTSVRRIPDRVFLMTSYTCIIGFGFGLTSDKKPNPFQLVLGFAFMQEMTQTIIKVSPDGKASIVDQRHKSYGLGLLSLGLQGSNKEFKDGAASEEAQAGVDNVLKRAERIAQSNHGIKTQGICDKLREQDREEQSKGPLGFLSAAASAAGDALLGTSEKKTSAPRKLPDDITINGFIRSAPRGK